MLDLLAESAFKTWTYYQSPYVRPGLLFIFGGNNIKLICLSFVSFTSNSQQMYQVLFLCSCWRTSCCHRPMINNPKLGKVRRWPGNNPERLGRFRLYTQTPQVFQLIAQNNNKLVYCLNWLCMQPPQVFQLIAHNNNKIAYCLYCLYMQSPQGFQLIVHNNN